MGAAAAGCPYDRIGIAGLGLIGGSIAMAVRRAWPDVHIVGVDEPGVLDRAREAHAIDDGAHAIRELGEVDLVVLAAPIPAVIVAIGELSTPGPSAVITDVASTKRRVMDAARAATLRRFIGGHPMAGEARGGFDHARADLFEGRRWVVVPGWDDAGDAVTGVEAFVHGLGARPERRDAVTHDRVMAAVSHLPQMMAVALMNVAARANTDEDLALAGPAFREMTRLASSPADLWRTILSSNADELGDAARAFLAEMTDLAARAGAGEAADLFAEANRHRERFEAVGRRE